MRPPIQLSGMSFSFSKSNCHGSGGTKRTRAFAFNSPTVANTNAPVCASRFDAV
jgi:hypothetical protein